MNDIDLSIPSGAIFSNDRQYRYALWRIWNPNRPLLMQVSLNPSDANEKRNDPTITRGVVRADRNSFGGFLMSNLYSLVSTDPKKLLDSTIDAIGELTDYYIKKMVELSERQLCGWGSFKPVVNRADDVYKMLTNPYCLGTNADGQPKHPLYISYETEMIKYSRR